MIKYTVLFTLLFSFSTIICQERALQLVHKNGNRVITLKENSRILVRTIDGEKYKGRFQMSDEGQITIKDQHISLKDIRFIKRKPLAVKIIKGVLLIPGTVLIAVSIFATNPLAVSVGIATGIFVNGAVLAIPEFFLTTRYNSKWSFKIINL